MSYPMFLDKWLGPWRLYYAEYPLTVAAADVCVVTQIDCHERLECVLHSIPVLFVSDYSAGAKILSLLPTLLSFMDSNPDELLRIHIRYPLLAFLLSLCNPSTFSSRITTLNALHEPVLSSRGSSRLLGYRGIAGTPTWQIERLGNWNHPLKSFLLVLLYLFVAGLAVISVRQTIMIGLSSAITFSCWTWFWPLIWVTNGAGIHIINVILWRLCLGAKKSSSRSNASVRLCWNLAENISSIELRHPHWARAKTLLLEILGFVNYAYATAIFSSMLLVSPLYAILNGAIFSATALGARLVAILLLEVLPNDGAFRSVDFNVEQIVR